MKVIGAGFGRTGTMSLKLALDQLGLGPTLHNTAFTPENQKLNAAWHYKANGFNVPWSDLLDGYGSTVDWPMAFYWREMAAEYPDAPVILTHRPAREWLASFKRTILPRMARAAADPKFDRTSIKLVLADYTFRGDFSDDNLLRTYAKHVAEVKAAFPAGRLLVFNVKEGWAPLCRFLGQPVPDEPFPVTNDAREFEERHVA